MNIPRSRLAATQLTLLVLATAACRGRSASTQQTSQPTTTDAAAATSEQPMVGGAGTASAFACIEPGQCPELESLPHHGSIVGTALSTSEIQQTMREKSSDVRICYEAALKSDASLQGTVATTFEILPDGRVTNVAATGVSDGLELCVVAALKTLRFRAHTGAGNIKVNFPFDLKQPK